MKKFLSKFHKDEGGAISTMEILIIAGVVVAAAIAIGAIIKSRVEKLGDQMETEFGGE